MNNIALLSSGGDAPGMNAAIRAVVRTGIYHGLNVFGISEGYDGLINGKINKLELSSVADIIHRGGTILRTARSDEFMTERGLEKALNVLSVYDIDALIVLGGDGTFRGAESLERKGVKIIGIPCTIDNDLAYTDKTVGFLTAVETASEAISKLRDTSESHGRAIILEVMGRNCGDIALYSGVAGGAESIVIPEVEIDTDNIIKKIIRGKNRGKRHHIIVVAEGAKDSYELKHKIEEVSGVETRITVLGHVQRGGTPNVLDRIYASIYGRVAVELLIEGKHKRVLGIKDNKIIDMDIEEALKMKKTLNEDLLKLVEILAI